MENKLLRLVYENFSNGKRIVAPLLGFPGIQLANTTVKLAQQNYRIHFDVICGIVKRFNPDIVFPLMDLSVEANALGIKTVFPVNDSATVCGEGFDFSQLSSIKNIDITGDGRVIGYVETMRLMKSELPAGIFKGAYVSGPFTLAGLIMGTEEAFLAMMMSAENFNSLLEVATQKILDYTRLLFEAGADLVCVLEPSAVMLSPEQFEQFSVRYVKEIVRFASSYDVSSVYHVCGNAMHLIRLMSGSGVQGISIDSEECGIDLGEVERLTAGEVAIMGNLSPIRTILTGTPEQVRTDVIELLEETKNISGFVLSTGCDLPADVPLENVDSFMKTGRGYKIR